MKSLISRLLAGAAVIAVLGISPHRAANAQAQPALPVLQQALGGQVSVALTAQGAGTVVTPDQTNYGDRRVACLYNQASHTGTPSGGSVTIQGKDPVSGVYFTLATTTTVPSTSDGAAYLSAGVGLATTSNVSAGVAIPPVWRGSVTVAGTTPTVTGTLTCWHLG